MINNIPLFQVYDAMARHAAESQRVSAQNVSHAGEPGYTAQEVEPFSAFLERVQSQPEQATGGTAFRISDSLFPASPNGNNVSIETEMYKSAEALSQHNMALSVYTKSLDLLRTAIGRRG